MKQMTHKMLNRRSQKGYVTNEKFQRVWDYRRMQPHLVPPVKRLPGIALDIVERTNAPHGFSRGERQP